VEVELASLTTFMIKKGMKSRWLIRVLLTACIAGLVWKAWKLAGDDPILLLILFIFAGAVAGFFVVKVILPWFAEAIGTSIYLSGERLPLQDKANDDETENEEPTSKG
jgi:hypothetical protein